MKRGALLALMITGCGQVIGAEFGGDYDVRQTSGAPGGATSLAGAAGSSGGDVGGMGGAGEGSVGGGGTLSTSGAGSGGALAGGAAGSAGEPAQGGAGGQVSSMGGGQPSGGGGTAGSGGGAGAGGASDECQSGVGDRIFAVTSEAALVAFDPVKTSFSAVGKLACPVSAGATPFSMAVHRTGVAYVLYSDGNIFLASTKDGSCQPSGYQPNQLGWTLFGMGFAAEEGAPERLYVIDGTSSTATTNRGLGAVSFDGKLSLIGQFDMGLAGRSAEVTGRGDGRLFAFFVDSVGGVGSSIVELDKTTAHVISSVPQSFSMVTAWAFAHWGGSFFLFEASAGGKSRVHKYTPDKGVVQVVDDAGYTIVGAGVSTCAPTVEPAL